MKDSDPENRTLTVTLAEDKSPRGKFAFNIQGSEGLKHRISSMNIQGAKDKTISFRIRSGMDELPVGDYAVSYGSISYGKDKAEGHSTSFQNVPAFTVKADETTTVELGKVSSEVRAVDLAKRYRSDVKYKTEFEEGTSLFVDVVVTGIAKEKYRSFDRKVKKENYTTNESYPAKLTIVDSDNNEVVTTDMEYG